MRTRFPSRPFIGLIFILLVSCAKPTIEPTVVKTCTLLGCSSSTKVSITEQPPDNYTVDFSDQEGASISITCIGENYLPGAEIHYSGILSTSEFTGDWLTNNIPNFQPCNDADGYYSVLYQISQKPVSINKQCGGPPISEFFLYSHCLSNRVHLNEYSDFLSVDIVNGVVLVNFAPKELEIHFQSQATDITMSVNPTYRVEQPNGAGCEPTCNYANIDIELP
jgi:hypothetical protein